MSSDSSHIVGKPNRRVLGLDVGERRIGVAISGESRILATPFTTIKRVRRNQYLASISNIIRQEGADLIVVGLPLLLDGTIGLQARRTLDFCENLREAVAPLPVETWDERYSSAEAERLLIEMGIKPSKQKGRVDAIAAAIVLQAYLDAHLDAHNE